MEPQERILIQQAQTGDLRAFESLIRGVDKKVMALAFQMLNNQQDAEDVYQEVFLKVFSNLKGFRFQSSFYTWIYRIAVRCAIDYRKKRKPHTVTWTHEYLQGREAWSDGATPETAVLDGELREQVRSTLDQLTAMQRTVLFLRYTEGLPLKDIAEATGCSQGAVKQHLFRGTRKAKKSLSVYIA
jgi:RNA polymerase sigma-70 factor (ECF subfamily)